jgi:fumarate hydratase subunit beta
MKKINLPISKAQIRKLVGGQEVLLSGTIFTARDAAHKRMDDSLKKGEALPIKIKDACIYYAGPCPAKPGQVIGSCGPTTSSRMDAYAPKLYDLGLSLVIGKGNIGDKVKKAIKDNGGCYLAATGGAGALLASCIKHIEVIAYDDLGAESIKKLQVVDMPLIVAVKTDYDIYKI